jgi:non-canonical purine NTP pyrophosphatase (RdgB/HAM1 family)
MLNITFITGNPHKAEVFAKYMGQEIKHQKIDLDEIQSMDLREITAHKLKQAYNLVNAPVLVEDSGCAMDAFGKFPGPFIKWMVQEISLEDICRLLDAKDRSAVAGICFGYYDGKTMKFFEGNVHGKISEHPRGESGFGWNSIFIPEGSAQTYAESGENFREVAVFPELKKFLESIDSK